MPVPRSPPRCARAALLISAGSDCASSSRSRPRRPAALRAVASLAASALPDGRTSRLRPACPPAGAWSVGCIPCHLWSSFLLSLAEPWRCSSSTATRCSLQVKSCLQDTPGHGGLGLNRAHAHVRADRSPHHLRLTPPAARLGYTGRPSKVISAPCQAPPVTSRHSTPSTRAQPRAIPASTSSRGRRVRPTIHDTKSVSTACGSELASALGIGPGRSGGLEAACSRGRSGRGSTVRPPGAEPQPAGAPGGRQGP